MKVLKMLLNIFTAFAAIVILGETAIAVVPHISGGECYAVMTNSMTPTLNTGDLIVVRPVKFDEIGVGDLVTFGSAYEKNFVFTHRIVNIDRKNQLLYTKGDANSTNDVAPTPYSNVIGRMTISFPMIGSIGIFMKSQSGIRTMVAVLVLWLLMEITFFIARKKSQK